MKAFARTDVGKMRTTNQDFVFSSMEPVGNLPNLFIVADGMGGHKAGDLASRFTVETFIDDVKNSDEENPISVIEAAIRTANRALLEKALESEEYEGMGTTLVVATILDHSLYIANVGDSRLYLVNNEIMQITRDHSLVEEMISLGELDKERARVHAKKNIITKAVGAEIELIPDFFEVECSPGDIILMCSDGLSNMIEDKDIKNIINEGTELSDIAHRLIEVANNNGGKDNIAVVLIEPEYDEVNVC